MPETVVMMSPVGSLQISRVAGPEETACFAFSKKCIRG